MLGSVLTRKYVVILQLATRLILCNTVSSLRMFIFCQVFVDKGMNHGQKITFRGEGDQEVSFNHPWVFCHEHSSIPVH